MLSSRCFTVLSLIQINKPTEIYLAYDMRNGSRLIFPHMKTQISQHHLWKRFITFSLLCIGHLSQSSYMDGSISGFSILFHCTICLSCAIAHYPNYCHSIIYGYMIVCIPQLCSNSSSIILPIPGPIHSGILVGVALYLEITLERTDFFHIGPPIP